MNLLAIFIHNNFLNKLVVFLSGFFKLFKNSIVLTDSVPVVSDQVGLGFIQVSENLFLFKRCVGGDEFVNLRDELGSASLSILEHSERRDVNVHEVVALVARALSKRSSVIFERIQYVNTISYNATGRRLGYQWGLS